MLLPVLILVVLVALVAGCGTEDGSAAAPPSVGPAAFPDESWAELATDGNGDLWLAVAGYERSGEFGLRVFRRDGSAWEELPAPPGRVSRDLPISITAPDGSDGAPCLGYSAGSRPAPVVACLGGGEWQSLDVPSLGRGHLLQLVAQDGDLVALIGEQRGSTSRYRLIRNAGEEWTLTPSVSVPSAVARLAIEGPQRQDANFPGIGFATQGRSAKHFVAELRGGRWQRLQPTLEEVGTGPLVGGPVITDKRVLYPVNEADTEPWTFSVQTARLGSVEARPERLSIGAGNAQGRLDLVAGRVWATWQEHEPLRSGGFRTAIYAAELRPDGKPRRTVRLWRGVSIGPGSTQVVEFQGRTLALFMRASSDGRGLQATVKRIS